ncbi:MAG: hypothetical protein KI792_12255 [Alphaproteobacteria bacterium]|nr:hypothetical protein [Alphaproteobacteria bacterium SS10]
MTKDKPDNLPDETDSLFDSLRRMGSRPAPGKATSTPPEKPARPKRPSKPVKDEDVIDPPAGLDRPVFNQVRSSETVKKKRRPEAFDEDQAGKTLSRRKVDRDGTERRHASQVIPPDESAHTRRSRLIRELEAGREAEFDDDAEANPLADLIRATPKLPDAAKKGEDAPKEKAAPKKAKDHDSLMDLAQARTPIEEYKRRRKLLTYDLELTPEGLDSRYVKYDRKNLAKVFAEMLAARQFDTFSTDRVWRASRMESRITFLNAVMAIHSKIYGYQPAKLDDRFYEDITNYPSSASNPTGITSYDRERGMIQLYPTFWNNGVNFPDMISEVIEQNTRNHVRQMVQLYTVGQLKHDDPRFGQAALFNVQIETYDELVNARTTEEVKAGKRVTTAMFMPDHEKGFDDYAKACAARIKERLFEVIDDPSDSDDRGGR